ncbi:uncharacterized protein PHACADRAFT_249275 [Phanerochaete carnosa HHB-10118-sp]|uniref:DUF6699 domain-containing protein n=1 Tax=Phanerochaete carnosa (strain HHB-10118-sp) TaxID=650164 RepID=K5X875_PHACS|nr:uncharacterized protein PHACADRAFT_249275 [Phanerochaete carnosa HHB-10118-sp]EKM59082.1 hypothetical protein PHACADRAFT_249275 [Phanerochaete carnosa HHB-10118-sp]
MTPAAFPTSVATPVISAVPAATPAWPTMTSPGSWPSPPEWLWQSAPGVALIPTLGLNPVEPSYPHLKWDVAHMPAAATVKHVTGRVLVKPITPKEFRQPALYPPHLDVHVTLGNVPVAAAVHARWGPIVVRCNAKGDVSVGDVLDGVYAYFQQPLYFEDMCAFENWLGKGGDPNYEALLDAFRQRVKNSDNLSAVEWNQGFKRIDMLGDNRRWCGLYRVPPSVPGDQTVSFNLYLLQARRA